VKVLIIGGVAAGMSAATRLRRLDEKAEIIVFERGEHVSYANCGLPYYLSDVISERTALLLQTPESLHQRFRLDVRVNHEVLSIDREAKKVSYKDLSTGAVSDETFDRLVIATGAKPRPLNVPGEERVLYLRDVKDADNAKSLLGSGKTKSAVIVGGGFIGVELAENLVRLGLKVSLVHRSSSLLSIFDPEMIAPFEQSLTQSGVDLHLNSKPMSITSESVILDTGQTLAADAVFAAAGVQPESWLAQAAGLEMAAHGGIKVDETLQTSDANIFAAGDAVEKPELFTGDDGLVPLANLANHHGRIIADVIAGRHVRNSKSLGTAIVGAFGMVAAITGLSERAALSAGLNIQVIHLHPGSHAGYYPGAERMALKVVFDKVTGRIYGAQAVGADGVDKRIDVLSTSIRAGFTVDDLMDLELAYAPQFGSAKDAVNLAGYVGNNVWHGVTPTVQWHEVADLLGSGCEFIDVRTAEEYAQGHIPGAVNIDVNNLRDPIAQIKTDDPVVYCAVGQRGHIATQILKSYGLTPRNLDGGYSTWVVSKDKHTEFQLNTPKLTSSV
jgi:NADPH-dependent 2,4-dienoyl-CoA reductase/sulfur reductase-like enzyme/rhodanese-related sulfurtransferase